MLCKGRKMKGVRAPEDHCRHKSILCALLAALIILSSDLRLVFKTIPKSSIMENFGIV